MGNPRCPECKKTMVIKWRNTIVGVKMLGRSKFWVCKECKIQFKVGGEVIRCKGKNKSKAEIDTMLKPLMIEQARERRQSPSVRMRP